LRTGRNDEPALTDTLALMAGRVNSSRSPRGEAAYGDTFEVRVGDAR
jgi:hypothetical protein